MTAAVPSELIVKLRAVLGAERVDDDEEARELAGQDVFTTGLPVAAIIRPTSAADVQSVVAFARASGLVLVPRGAGMSYTSGYLSAAPDRTIVLDMRAMASIVEVNARDLYAIVEPGCTWQALSERLAGEGLEAPYRGPVSGRLATVGGAIAQNAVFYGSGLYGMAADNVIGVEVVTGTGAKVRTGSFGVSGGSPFLRHFGPDLTGLFTADCGVMGIKTAIVLRLRRAPAMRDAVSFQSADISAIFAFLEAVGREEIASQIIAMDGRLEAERIKQVGWRERVNYARSLLTGGGSVLKRMSEGAAVAKAGMSTASGGRGMIVHVFLEGDAQSCVRDRALATSKAQALGLAPGNSAVALAMLRTPFGPVTGLAGSPGERWVPVHFILPHTRALAGMEAIQQIVAAHAAELKEHGIKVRNMLATLGGGAVTLEPMFLWRDKLTDFARKTLLSQGGNAPADAAQRPAAEAFVKQIRREMVERLDAMGAIHTQLGRSYPYQARLDGETATLFRTLHRSLDPDGVMNPGALDTSSPIGGEQA